MIIVTRHLAHGIDPLQSVAQTVQVGGDSKEKTSEPASCCGRVDALDVVQLVDALCVELRCKRAEKEYKERATS